MSVVAQLKAKAIDLRKQRSPLAASIQFALSEIENVGKNNGNRTTTDDEAIKVVQKIIASIKTNIDLSVANDKDSDGRTIRLIAEKNILMSVLPQMVEEEDIRAQLVFAFGGKQIHNKGEVMKWAKARWGATADMKLVGTIASELFGV